MIRAPFPTLAGIAIALTCAIAAPSVLGEPEHSRPLDPIYVVDGDTIRIQGTPFRLVGFDTAETGSNARCQAEDDLGEMAKERLQELVATTDISIIPVECACRPGTQGTRRCNFGRMCARLKANGEDVGAILIREGLARRYVCGATTCPKRKGWC